VRKAASAASPEDGIQRPEPSAQTAPIIRQDLPALPHSPGAASLALSTVSRCISDQDFPEIAKAPQRLP
jgi:hypothetical protein